MDEKEGCFLNVKSDKKISLVCNREWVLRSAQLHSLSQVEARHVMNDNVVHKFWSGKNIQSMTQFE